jgi:hypothetical protein
MKQAPPSYASVLILGGADTERLMTAALQAPHAPLVRLDLIEEQTEFGRTRRTSDLVILDRARIDGPETVAEWLHSEILDPTVPLLIFAPSPIAPAEYRDWLAAGVWDMVRLPVDPAMLALRLRNLLGNRGDALHAAMAPHHPYPWPTLLRATGEVMALGRRHERPVSCVALAVERTGEGESPPRLMYRLGVSVRQWTRDSDLVGVTEQDVLVVVLPDTPDEYAAMLAPRLLAALERSLRRAGTVARLRSAARSARLDGCETATEFLMGAIRKVI